ncbi:MAG: hypothetical protein GY707_06235, partial [Desulfobacteraceae bacterium]|nr:hypothetical protein [Desulfobacteraceae bacterium]
MNKHTSTSEKLGVTFWLCIMWLVLIACLAIFADIIPLLKFDSMDWNNLNAPPCTSGTLQASNNSDGETTRVLYLFGTDIMGRDILTRLIYGARVSLAVGLITPLIGFLIGGFLGMTAGFYQGRVESFIMAIMDCILAFPGLVLLL